jgi:hypothetical protein
VDESIYLQSLELQGGAWLKPGERIEVRNDGGELRVVLCRGSRN